jgi:NAD(P)-dependent dehydrogenase (short-subunit alcohol dehydrogenase family)
LVLAGIGSVRVFGFAAERAKNSAISPDKNKAPYYSYKTFQKLGAPAIFYSTIAKISNKVRRVKPKEILASKPATDEKRPKVALVTGSNTGVGFQTAKTLALDHGCQVIIACRSREKGGAACNAINQAIEEDGVGNATFLAPLDLSNLDSVREFCQAVNKQYSTIDVLVNNAGKNTGGEPLTDQNLDDVFTTNFLGHFLLTNLLLEKCKRIVNLSSVMHHFPFYSKDAPYSDVTSKDLWSYAALDDIDSDHDDWNKSLRKPYAPSKLAALLFSIELNRRYQSNNAFRSFAVNPGAV